MHHVPGPQCLWAGAPATACCFTKHGVLSQPASQPANRSCGRSLVAWCPPLPASSSCRLCCHHCPHPCAPLAITMRRAYLGQLAHLPASLLPQLFPLCFCLIIRPPCLPLNLLFILFLVSFLSAPRFSPCSAPSPPLLSLHGAQMENICSLEPCKGPSELVPGPCHSCQNQGSRLRLVSWWLS